MIALITAYNEADILPSVIGHLISEGVDVHLVDDGSTDDTVEKVQPFLGKGLVAIETRPHRDTFEWEALLRGKEELARTLDADWFIHHDADEFRESPWPGVRLRDAIAQVDRLGFNAIDFHLLNFQPTSATVAPGVDVREEFRLYEPGRSRDQPQVKCWKKSVYSVDLVSSAGHDVQFPGRRIFPIPFLLRHYPIRGQDHGRVKVERDRRPRFVDDERCRGWHVQYDEFGPDHQFVRQPGAAGLQRFDPIATRIEMVLNNREVGSLRGELEAERQTAEALRQEVGRLASDLEKLLLEREEWVDERNRLLDEIVSHRQHIRALHESWSWRLMSPLRTLYDILTSRWRA